MLIHAQFALRQKTTCFAHKKTYTEKGVHRWFQFYDIEPGKKMMQEMSRLSVESNIVQLFETKNSLGF